MSILGISLESIPWVEIFWGFFISGIFLTLLALLSGLGGEESEVGGDFDHDIGVDHDVDVGIDHDVDVGVDHDIGIDHDVDIGIDHDFDFDHEGFVSAEAGAPFSLLFGGFLLIYGALGIILFSNPGFIVQKLLTISGITILSLWLLNFAWKKIFKMVTYEVPSKRRLVGRTAIVVHTVDAQGGSIKVDIGSPKGSLKFPEIPRDRNKVFKPGSRVVIVD